MTCARPTPSGSPRRWGGVWSDTGQHLSKGRVKSPSLKLRVFRRLNLAVKEWGQSICHLKVLQVIDFQRLDAANGESYRLSAKAGALLKEAPYVEHVEGSAFYDHGRKVLSPGAERLAVAVGNPRTALGLFPAE